MLQVITKELREFLALRMEEMGGKSGRAADREGAMLWLIENTGNGWGVCVTVGSVKPAGDGPERRDGLCDITLRFFIGLTPGLPEDTDKRSEALHLAWGYVWSYVARIRWGSVSDPEVPAEGVKLFTPADGFLDGNRAMLPSGTAEFSRVILKVTAQGMRPQNKELMLATQEWTLRAALPLLLPPGATHRDNFYLPGAD